MDAMAASELLEAELEEVLRAHRQGLQCCITSFLSRVGGRTIAFGGATPTVEDKLDLNHVRAGPSPPPSYDPVEIMTPSRTPAELVPKAPFVAEPDTVSLPAPNKRIPIFKEKKETYLERKKRQSTIYARLTGGSQVTPAGAPPRTSLTRRADAHVAIKRARLLAEEAIEEDVKDDAEDAPVAQQCPEGHPLQQLFTPAEGWRCNLCDEHQCVLASMQGCRICNYDICQECFKTGAVKDAKPKQKAVTFPGVVPEPPSDQDTKGGNDKKNEPKHQDEYVREKTRQAMQMRKSNFITASKQEVLLEQKTTLQRITMSKYYEMFSGFIILCNCIYIAYQTNFQALREEEAAAEGLTIPMTESPDVIAVQALFALVFTVELALRWMSDGRWFLNWRSKDFSWNLLDIVVVILDLVNFLLELVVILKTSNSKASFADFTMLRVLRIIRVVRVAKVIRVMKFFKELRMMMYSIFSCIRSLFWVAAVLFLFLGIFSILFTAAVSATLVTAEMRLDPKNAEVQACFGTLDRSTLSMYMGMSGGVDWGDLWDALEPLPSYYRPMFLLFITFAVFALVNIVTGLFVENAKQSSRQDREDMIQEELVEKATYLHSMQTLFEEMDFDGTGTINLEEFQATLGDERIEAYFNALRLDVSEAAHLFQLLDWDNSGEVSYIEFVEGCWKMQGEARSLDMKIMQFELAALHNKIELVKDWFMIAQPENAELLRAHEETC